jgi:4-hydroxybenzoate polyprenyltransferase
MAEFSQSRPRSLCFETPNPLIAVESMTSPNANNPYHQSHAEQVPVYANSSVIDHNVSVIFRLSRPRTWVFPSISLILGYSLTGAGWARGLLLAVAVACLVTASTNLVNAYADRREDLVNQPSRALWLERVGPRRVLGIAVVLYSAGVIVSAGLGLIFVIILTLGIAISVFYSFPPVRLKADPIRSMVSFSGAVGLPFLAGMSLNAALNLSNPFFWLCTYFMFTYGTVKNLPDYNGDKKAGVKTSATIFQDIRSAIIFSSVLLSTPYFLLAGLVMTGLVGTTYLLDLGFALVLFFILRHMWRTQTPEGLEKAHTVGFFYAISFLLFTLVLSSPTVLALVTVVGAYAWTLLVSKVNVDSRAEKRDWESMVTA